MYCNSNDKLKKKLNNFRGLTLSKVVDLYLSTNKWFHGLVPLLYFDPIIRRSLKYISGCAKHGRGGGFGHWKNKDTQKGNNVYYIIIKVCRQLKWTPYNGQLSIAYSMKASYLQRCECELEVQVGVVSLRVIVIMRHPVRAINGEHMSIV